MGRDASFGEPLGFPQGRTVKVTQIQNNATWTHGNHTLLLGGEFDYQNSTEYLSRFLQPVARLYDSFSDFLADSGVARPELLMESVVFPSRNRMLLHISKTTGK